MNDMPDGLLDMISRSRMAVFIGRTDTGKSTLIKNIASQIEISIIDADIGQSDIGPPSVVALGERRGGKYTMVDGYFCGSTTPARHFLQLLAGASRMAARVKRYPVLVNTTGLATGDVGRALKTEKINALRPDVIIGLGQGLEYLNAFGRTGAAVVHLPVPAAARQKSRAERAELRQKAFAEHFSGAETRCYSFKAFAAERSLLFNGSRVGPSGNVLHMDVSGDEALAVVMDGRFDHKRLMENYGIQILHAYTPDDFVNVLVGLIDERGIFAGLGIIESMDFEREELRLFTNSDDFGAIQFGSIRLGPKDFAYKGSFLGRTYSA